MLEFATIEAIAKRVAKGQVADAGLERVVTEPMTDSQGKDALRITVVLTPQAAQALSGDGALDLLVELQNALQREGEERFPIIEYATEQELAAEAEASSEEDELSEDAD